MKVNRIKVFRWLKVIIIIYCIIGIALYYLQDKFLFHPEKLLANYKYQFDTPFEEMMIPVNKEDTISVVKFFPVDSVRKGVVLYYHGNMKNINHYARNAELFIRNGYEIWMWDYPGYGKTTGERNEEKMYQLSSIMYQAAAAKYASDSIILYGKSLGTGFATYVASFSPCKMLVLETPYYSIPSLFSHFAFIYPTTYMSNYKVPLNEYLADVKSPVIIFHGTADQVIPLSNAELLQPLLKSGDEFIKIEGGAHNTLPEYKIFKERLSSLLQ